MQNNELRPIEFEFNETGWDSNPSICKGFFHMWQLEGANALVEKEDGSMAIVGYRKVKFLDKPFDARRLRPVEFNEMTNHNGFVNRGELRNGYFHLLFKSIDSTSNDETVYAIVENEDGDMIETRADYVKFLDRNKNKVDTAAIQN